MDYSWQNIEFSNYLLEFFSAWVFLALSFFRNVQKKSLIKRSIRYSNFYNLSYDYTSECVEKARGPEGWLMKLERLVRSFSRWPRRIWWQGRGSCPGNWPPRPQTRKPSRSFGTCRYPKFSPFPRIRKTSHLLQAVVRKQVKLRLTMTSRAAERKRTSG